VSSSSSEAFCRMDCRVSMVRMNRNGDRGSSCRSPHLCLSHGMCTPLSLIEEEEQVNSRLSQFCHLAENPLYCINSMRYSQETKSNALDISSFRSMARVFFRWSRGCVPRVHDRDDSTGPWGVGIDPYYDKMAAG
jgi:hypothetical protein